MTYSNYDTIIEDSGREARSREQRALDHGVDLLRRMQSGDLPAPEASEALLYIRRLWAFFVEDLASPRNGLPEKLRAELISIGLWIIKEADRVRQDETTDVEELMAINIVIRDALA